MYQEISRLDRTLRPYQQEAKKNIFSAWDECDSVMFQMPTGTGKTRLFTSLISDIKAWSILSEIDAKILIVAHRIELIEQISENLDKYGITHGIIAGGKTRDLTKPIQVASIQTITHHTNREVIQDINVSFVIIDEAHHSMANSYKSLWNMFPNAKRLGVTATPWRMNHSGFTDLYDRLILSKPVQEFFAEGWLAPYDYYSISENDALKTSIDLISEYDIEGDYKVSALEEVVDTAKIRARLLQSYQTYVFGKKGIIYSISRAHSNHICSEYRKAGINIVQIDSETSRDTRRLYVKRFKEGSIDIIVNVDIFSEGFDCPDIEFIQLARPTKSLVKYLQQVGRGLRPTHGKNRCIILDNVGLHLEFGLPDTDRDWKTDFEGDPAYRIKRSSSNTGNTSTSGEELGNFEEGSEKLCLIKGPTSTDDKWSADDDELLMKLYTEKSCSLEILASVFKKPEEIISRRITVLDEHQSVTPND